MKKNNVYGNYVSYTIASLFYKLSSKSPCGLVSKITTPYGLVKNKPACTLFEEDEVKSYSARVDGKWCINYRIIYCLYNKCDVPSGMVVDHIDGNRLNNDPSNLQLLTFQQNQQKRKVRKDSKTGIKGVSLSKDKKYVVASFMTGENGFMKKYKISDFSSVDEALEVAKQWRISLEDEHCDVTERNPILNK